ncbi:MAG: hypothetical protein LUI02_03180 [Clostridiales bacterium]|nr:hypothetical protein [Clostridiales bacterium]
MTAYKFEARYYGTASHRGRTAGIEIEDDAASELECYRRAMDAACGMENDGEVLVSLTRLCISTGAEFPMNLPAGDGDEE